MRNPSAVLHAPRVLAIEDRDIHRPVADASRVGQLVALDPGAPCRRCRECRHGRDDLCPDVVCIYPLALRLISSGAVEVGSSVTHRFGLEQPEQTQTLGRDIAGSLTAVVQLEEI